jgi:hypothetical protein
MRRAPVAALACAAALAGAGTASAHTGAATPACTGFSYSLTNFGPFANTASYDVQGPDGQLAAGTIGPFGTSASGTIAYPAPFAGAGALQVLLSWDVPDDTRPRRLAGEATVTCTEPPVRPAVPAPVPPVAPATPTQAVTPIAGAAPPPRARARAVVVTERCRGPWPGKPPGVLSRRGPDGRWYGYRTRRVVTRRGGEVVRVRITQRTWCGPRTASAFVPVTG